MKILYTRYLFCYFGIMLFFTGCEHCNFYIDEIETATINIPNPKPFPQKLKFRINDIKLNDMGTIKNILCVNQILEKNYPQYFEDKKSSIPLTILLKNEISSLFLITFPTMYIYIGTLGMFPYIIPTTNCKITITCPEKELSQNINLKGDGVQSLGWTGGIFIHPEQNSDIYFRRWGNDSFLISAKMAKYIAYLVSQLDSKKIDVLFYEKVKKELGYVPNDD